MRYLIRIRLFLMLVAVTAVAGCMCNNSSPPPTSRYDEAIGVPTDMLPPVIPEPPPIVPPQPLVLTPRPVTPTELKHALAELPKGFLHELTGTDEEIAKQLGLKVWAFDFTGGPFGCWFEIAEIGQQTAFNRSPAASTFRCEAPAGKLLVWLQPRATREMPPALKQRVLRNKPQVADLFVAVDVNDLKVSRFADDGRPTAKDGVKVPLWFGWKDADVKESIGVISVKVGETSTLLQIEASEKGVAEPRKVRFELKVKK